MDDGDRGDVHGAGSRCCAPYRFSSRSVFRIISRRRATIDSTIARVDADDLTLEMPFRMKRRLHEEPRPGFPVSVATSSVRPRSASIAVMASFRTRQVSRASRR